MLKPSTALAEPDATEAAEEADEVARYRVKLYKELSRMTGEAGPEALSREVGRLRRRMAEPAVRGSEQTSRLRP
jgi:hypothetical protein